MKHLNFKKIISSLFIGSSILVPSILSSCSNVKIDAEIAKHDENGWKNTVEELSNTKIPTIFFNVGASFQIYQNTLMVLSADSLAKQKGHTYQDEEYKFADRISIITSDLYKYKTKTSPSLYAYNYGEYVSDNDILTDGIDKANNMLISNYEDFDLSLPDYVDKSNELSLGNFNKVIDTYNHIFKMYDEASGKRMNFNFFFNDYTPYTVDDEIYSKFMGLVLPRANKIYMCSDGRGSWSSVRDKYINQWKENGYTSASKQKEIWNSLHNASSIDEAAKIFSKNKIALQNNENYFQWFAADGNFYKSELNSLPDIKLTPDTWTKYSRSLLDWTEYKTLFNMTSDVYNDFSNKIKKFFNWHEGEKFENFVNYGTYDLNKKNLIIPLPKFVNTANEIRDNNIISIFNEIVKSYPIEQYNYIWKAHPRSTQEEIESGIKRIFNNQLPVNTIILKNTYPLEFLTFLDWDLVKNNVETKYHMIDPNSFAKDENEVSGLFAGFSFDTSCVMITMNALANYKLPNGDLLGWNNALKLLSNKSMFLPTRFQYSGGATGDDMYQNNLNSLKYEYEQFCSIGEFHKMDYFKKI